MTRGPATAVLLCGALLTLPAAACASGAAAADGYRVHPGADGTLRPLVAVESRPALAFHAPDGYVFTVTRAGAAAMRAAGARPLDPAAGLWGVGQAEAPALRRRLEARGALVDATVDARRGTHVEPEPAPPVLPPEPFLGLQYMFAAVGAAGLEPPPGGEEGGVLVIDSGLDAAHAEFAGRAGLILENPQVIRATTDGEWHGTAVASTIGAPRNGVGIEGLYPTVRLGAWDGGGDGILTSQTISALRRAADRGYQVVNMSFGGEGFTLPELLAVYRAMARGILVVAAAGNENEDGNPDEYPALFPHVLTVTAVNEGSAPAAFSNRKAGNDLAAPGVRVLAATPQVFDLANKGLTCEEESQWCRVTGTSFAAPIASAAAAWVWAARPDLGVTQIFDLLRFSARDVGPPGFDRKTGFGVVDIRSALARKAPRTDPLEPNDEILLVDGRITGTPARFLLAPGRGSVGLRARLDYTEDPVDVYRVALSRGDRVRIGVQPLDDDCDLVVWPPAARSTGQVVGTGRQVDPVARSVRPGFKRDAVIVEAPETGPYYVDVRGNGRYDLVIQRLPRG